MATKEEIQQRISNLQTKLGAMNIDGALFIYPIDVFYFSGTRQNGVLWVPVEGEPVLLIRKSFFRAQQESPLSDIRPFSSSQDLPALLGEGYPRIGLTLDVIPVQQYNYYAKLLTGREMVDISALNRTIRSVKTPWEIEQMKNSAQKICQVYAEIPEFLKPGMREIDFAAEFECRVRKLGHEGYVRMRAYNQELFFGHISSGVNAAYPGFFDGPTSGKGLSQACPQSASTEVIAENVPILVDYAGIFNGYIVDMTRIYTFGSIEPNLKKAFDVALAIQNYLAANLKPGSIPRDLFAGAWELASQVGISSNFMGIPGEQAKFVGHGLGLELDELPIIAQNVNIPLKTGQVIALEPKFVFSGQGVVGIENTFVVAEQGGIKLTEFPDDLLYLD